MKGYSLPTAPGLPVPAAMKPGPACAKLSTKSESLFLNSESLLNEADARPAINNKIIEKKKQNKKTSALI